MQKPRLWTPDFVLLFAIAFLAYILVQGLNNGLPLYVARYGGTTAVSGFLILEFSLAAAVARIIAGRFIDTGSRKRIMFFGALSYLAGTSCSLVIPGVEAQFAFRIFQGIGLGCVSTAVATASADVVPVERLGEGIGYCGLSQSLGMAIGPTFAVLLASMPYKESLFVGLSAVSVILVMLVLFCKYESHPASLPKTSTYRQRFESAAQPLATSSHAEPSSPNSTGKLSIGTELFERNALVGALPMLVCSGAFAIVLSFTSLYAAQRGFENPGIFFVFAAFTMTAVRLWGGKLIDRIAPIKFFAVPVFFGVVTFLMLGLARSPLVLYASGISFGLSMGLAIPILNTTTIRNTPPERWGAANALFYLMVDAGMGLGALMWGAVVDMAGFTVVMYGGAVVLALSFILALLLFPKQTA